MSYIYRFDVAAFIVAIAILISLLRNKTIRTRIVSAFEVWFIFIALSSSFDILSIYLLGHPGLAPNWVSYIVNICYHASFIFLPQIFYYTIYYSTEDNKVPSSLRVFIFTLPYICILIFLFLSPFTGAIFYFDKDYQYHRGKLFALTYACAAFYLVACIYRSIRYKSSFSPLQFFAVWFYMILSVATLIIQYFFPRMMLMNFSIAVSSMVGYLSLENPSDYLDKEMPMFNRNGFVEYMNHHLSKRKNIPILGLQIVGFKAMENTIGKNNKNELLKHLGNDMLMISPMHRNFRISQSRFAILLDENPEKQKKQIEQIIDYSLQPFNCGDAELLISVKSTLINCPEDASSVDDIMELMEHSFVKTLTETDRDVPHADRNILLKRYSEQKILEKIKNAINSGNFDIYYQPLYDTVGKKFYSAEALIRVKTTNQTIIKPEDFLPLTEKSGMIVKIGEFVIDAVCKYISEEKPYEKGIQYITINLSILQCMQEDLGSKILAALEKYNVLPEYIRFEVTESSTLLAKDVLFNTMTMLSQKGVKFILDDFGNGLSNMAELMNFPFTAVKIDENMIDPTLDKEKSLIILKETIAMMKEMNLEIIAECVETEEQSLLLNNFGCNYMQGYYYCKPLTGSQLNEFLCK